MILIKNYFHIFFEIKYYFILLIIVFNKDFLKKKFIIKPIFPSKSSYSQKTRYISTNTRSLLLKKKLELHVVNCRVHNSKKTKNWLEENEVIKVQHRLYSPDLAPCDYFLFDIIKEKLKWTKKPVPTEKNQFLKFLSLKISMYFDNFNT